jgi:hypothetical protein
MGVRLNDICRRCNSGWMERIESATRPILTPPIQGTGVVLGAEDARGLAVWSLKTAMVIDLLTRSPDSFFTANERNAMRTTADLLPAGVLGIWMAAVDGVNHVASAIDYRVAFSSSTDTSAELGSGYCVTLSVGHVAFQVFAIRNFPDPRFTGLPFSEAVWEAAQLKLFPFDAVEVRWPPHRKLDPTEYSAFIDRWRPNG